MRIILDAMGGDNAPLEIVLGAIEAVKEWDVDITLVGDEGKISTILKENKVNLNKFEIINASEVITNDEAPTVAIRRKKDSSMVVGLNLLKDHKGDAFISAGSTGALLTGGTLIVKRIKGIDRPALSPVLPGKEGSFMLMDAGANTECKPKNILQFAIMGEIYSKKVLNKKAPTVGLINNGAEEEKGSIFTKECYQLLKNSDINFVGNIEGNDVPRGTVDVMVCDGFTGNIVLKVYEGVVSTIFSILKDGILSSLKTKVGGLLIKPVFKKFKKDFDYNEYGGAILLGVNSPVIKAHGNSKARVIKNTIRQAMLIIDGEVVKNISDELQKYNFEEL